MARFRIVAIFVLVMCLCGALTSCGTFSPNERRLAVLQKNMAFFCDSSDEELAREVAKEIFAIDKDNRMARHYLKIMGEKLEGKAREELVITEDKRLSGLFTGDQNMIIDAFVRAGSKELTRTWSGLSIKGDRFSISKTFYFYLSELDSKKYSMEGFIQWFKDDVFNEIYPEDKDGNKQSVDCRKKRYSEFCDSFDKNYFNEVRGNYQIFRVMEVKAEESEDE